MIRLPPLSSEEKEYLRSRGYTPFQPSIIGGFYRPLNWKYQLTNLTILGVSIPLRSYFKRMGYLYFPLTLTIIAVPFMNLLGLTRINSETESMNGRHSHAHFLQHLPKVTREAYVQVSGQLKREIKELQRENQRLREMS